MNDTLQQGILTLIHSAISGQKLTLPEGFDIEQTQKLIKMHQIGNLVYYGAANCGMDTKSPLMQELFAVTYQCILVDQRQLRELDKLLKAFDQKGIHYMPVKGVLMKQLYPRSDMRIMGDADIMIKLEQYDKIKAIVEQFGYTFVKESDHELVWENSNLYLELHKQLISGSNKDLVTYYGDCWRLGKPSQDNACRYEMRDEDQMIYLFTHFAKHYRTGGIGIRHMTDLYVYKKAKPTLDQQYIAQEMEKLQMSDFYRNVFDTLDVWFENGTENSKTKLITEHVFSSGAYGTHLDRYVADAIWNRGETGENSKHMQRKAWVQVIFLPYSSMCVNYPVLKKAPILLPVMWVARWINILFKRPDRIRYQKDKINLLKEDQLKSFEGRMNAVGLTFGFEEDDE